MGNLSQSLRRIPFWAYLLVFMVIFVNALFLHYRIKQGKTGEIEHLRNDHWVITSIEPGSPVSRTEIKIGDTIVSCNSYPLEEWHLFWHGQWAGDTLIFGMLRNNLEVGIPVITVSAVSSDLGFLMTVFILIVLFSIGSLYLLYKKLHDKAVKLFFIYFQLLLISFNAAFLPFTVPLSILATLAFLISGCLFTPCLIHFYLLFPKPSLLITRIRYLPSIFYMIGVISGIITTIVYLRSLFFPSDAADSFFMMTIRYSLYSVTATFFIAILISLFQYITMKNTLARYQVLLLFIGSLAAFTPILILTFFYDWITGLSNPYTLELLQTVGNLILVLCVLIAIFRYRIWDVEVFIRKALLYLAATAVIVLFYLMMIWLVDQFFTRESDLTRFLVLAISVITFLVLRDRIQRLIDRLFQRESYDSATVVSDFEGKLSGVYRIDDLKQKIVQELNNIFHFKSIVFILKKNGLIYEPAFVYGVNDPQIGPACEISREFEQKLSRSKVFSPEELSSNPPFPEISTTELIVPMITEDQVKGFLLCGPKRSEKTYSQQDIRVLSTLARRVVSLLHTANLYQKDLDRQLMLERERARISQDMHDDVGASLTRISILSELAKNNPDTVGETRQWLGQISDTSRGVMEEMSQIIWALNPKNDTLQGLIAYIRRFANEYLEPTSIACTFKLPETLPNLPLTVEVRRNIYLVVREALHNVVKHSGATEVKINLTPHSPRNFNDLTPQPPLLQGEGEKSFTITIRDNGKGFDPAALEFPGNGLVNMKKRMQEIGGEFGIISNPGAGTDISVTIFS
ncbi:MAG: hypothetical protein IH596_04465 [Bacteroidales bacterium]|nr:hypothetical protein [Bacteroidales bacterium]